MKRIITRKAVLLLLMLLSPGAFAVIIEGTIRGTVSSIGTYEDYLPLEGYWENAAIGSEVSGNFWYDTDFLPALPPDTLWYYYDDFSDWLGTSVTIEGKTYVLSEVAPKNSDAFFYDEIVASKFDPSMTGTDFWLLDIAGVANRGARAKMMDFYFSFNSSEFTLFNGWDLVENFDWYDVGDPATSAYFNFSLEINNASKRMLSGVSVDVDEFHLRIKKPASVPEPSSIMLLCLGIIACAIKLKRNR